MAIKGDIEVKKNKGDIGALVPLRENINNKEDNIGNSKALILNVTEKEENFLLIRFSWKVAIRKADNAKNMEENRKREIAF